MSLLEAIDRELAWIHGQQGKPDHILVGALDVAQLEREAADRGVELGRRRRFYQGVAVLAGDMAEPTRVEYYDRFKRLRSRPIAI